MSASIKYNTIEIVSWLHICGNYGCDKKMSASTKYNTIEIVSWLHICGSMDIQLAWESTCNILCAIIILSKIPLAVSAYCTFFFLSVGWCKSKKRAGFAAAKRLLHYDLGVIGLKHGNNFYAHVDQIAYNWSSLDPVVAGALCAEHPFRGQALVQW